MSLPFRPPRQLLAVDDVLPVEIIGDCDTGWQDAREHLGVEHYAGSTIQDSAHRVVVVPVAVAILAVDTSVSVTNERRFRVVHSQGFSNVPTWLGNYSDGCVFEFSVPAPWCGIGVGPRSSSSAHAVGWIRIQDPSRPYRGRVHHPLEPDALEGILITVLGLR